MLGRLRHLQPVVDDTGYRRHAENTQEQLFLLTDSLSPSMLRECGLPGVLSHGALVRILREAGLIYTCDIRGPVSTLPPSMDLAIYRIVCEAVNEVCQTREPAELLVKIRCGRSERAGLVLMVESRRHPVGAQLVDWDILLRRLRVGVTGLGRKAIEDRAATFHGQVRERKTRQGTRLVVSLWKPNHPHD